MKNYCVYWIKTADRHTTVHSTICKQVTKHIGFSGGTLPKDPKGKWGYEEFDSVEEADKFANDLLAKGIIKLIKDCRNEDCRMLRGIIT